MTFSQPGPLWYYATLVSVTARENETTITGHFQVFDSTNAPHNGMALDGSPQPLLDVEISAFALPADINAYVRTRIQELVLAEYGGDLQAVIGAAIQQGAHFG
jgi:hypothetical protein